MVSVLFLRSAPAKEGGSIGAWEIGTGWQTHLEWTLSRSSMILQTSKAESTEERLSHKAHFVICF